MQNPLKAIGTILTILSVLLSFSARTVNSQHVLKSADLEVIVDIETGRIAEIHDLQRPDSSLVFGAGEDVLAILAGEYSPSVFSMIAGDSSFVSITSPAFENQDSSFSLATGIEYRLTGNSLKIKYLFEARERLGLDEGLEIMISSSMWDLLVIRNHFSGEEPFVLSEPYLQRFYALDQVFELHNDLRNMNIVFPNPYHSLVTVATPGVHRVLFRWNLLAATFRIQAVEPKGPDLASVLQPGVRLHRQLELVVAHEDDEPEDLPRPIAYLSPFPNGYDQVIAMTFDDIPFGSWKYPKSGHDPNTPMQQYLIRLLEDHPKMKMGWVVLPDAILSESDLINPDYTPGKWWEAHGRHRILTNAPDDYLEWLYNIENESVVYGYEDRVRLGSHGYHHTPEMEFGANFEFQYYDPAFNDSTFSAIAREYALLGLSEKSRRWIRFPGFHFTRATIETLIKYGFVLFDFWGIYDRLPWMLFYSDHGRIWGIGTWWEGDTPSPYEEMDKLLRAGKLCHTAGHPYKWFEGDSETAYQQIHSIFLQAEMIYPHLGYMFPDEAGFFADETYDIHDIETEIRCGDLYFSFVGSATMGQTVKLEWPEEASFPTGVTVDGLDVLNSEIRGQRVTVVLPSLDEGPHTVLFSAALGDTCEQQIPPADLVLFQNYPNPFNSGTLISYDLPETAHVSLTVYNVLGKRVAVIVDGEQQPDTYTVEWNGRDDAGRNVASGIYFYRLSAGNLSRVRKLVLLR